MTEPTFFPDDLVVGKSGNGSSKLGVVEQVHGIDNSDESSDSEMEEYSSTPLERGFVRLSWYPDGKVEVVKESKIELVDRYCLPGEVVRKKDGNQLGTALTTRSDCDVVIVGTSKILKGISVSDLVPTTAFEGEELVSYDPWLGRVEEVMEKLLLKFSNGSRAKLDLEIDDFEDLLVDVYPHASDKGDFNTTTYYPGQILRCPAKIFKDVKWISGEKMKFKPKTHYNVLVEQIEVYAVKIKWGTRAFPEEDEILNAIDPKVETKVTIKKEECCKGCGSSVDPEPSSASENIKKEGEKNPAEPPSDLISNEALKKLHLLNQFWRSHIWIGERYRYKLNEEQADDLNQQINKNTNKTKQMRLAKRMDQKLHHSTNKSPSSPGLSRKGRKRKQVNSSHNDKSESEPETDEDWECDEDDLENDDNEDDEAVLPSSGSCASIAKEVENDIEVFVNTESDMTISSPMGQRPTILGRISCRMGNFELDFTLIQEECGLRKKKFQCNIQNPEYTKDNIERVSQKFKNFMKSRLKENKNMMNDTDSYITMMSQCPLGIRLFIKEQSTVVDTEIYFEMTTAEGNHTSGMIDKDGKKSIVEFMDDDDEKNFNSFPMEIIPGVVENTITTEPNDYALTTGPLAVKQAGANVKFTAGQYVTVEVARTSTNVDVQWQDGTMEDNIRSLNLSSVAHVDDNDFCPGDFVIDKRVSEEESDLYGVVLTGDSEHRMTKIQWIKEGKPIKIEEVSSYEVADHPELCFSVSDIIVRISNLYNQDSKSVLTNDYTVGELLRICEYDQGMLEVLWANGSIARVHPKDVLVINNEDEEGIFGSSESDIDEFGDTDNSWTTASTDEDAGYEDDDNSEPAGDGDNPLSTNNRFGPIGVDSGSDDNDGAAGDIESIHDHIHETQNHEQITNHHDDDDQIHTVVRETIDNIIELAVEQIHENDHECIHGSIDHDENAVKSEEGNSTNSHELDENHNSAIIKCELDNKLESDEDNGSLHENGTCSAFSVESEVSPSHHFIKRYFDSTTSKTFIKAVQRDLKLLRTSLPRGITVKSYEDRMDLLSVLIEGPEKTPYEDGIFLFDIYLSSNYPESPPSVHYISFSLRLNPNLYETGRVCVSLLGTWSGKGSERWTKDSTVLQVLLSIQGLILNSEPYYNEAGYEGHRGTSEGVKNSRCYNEMVLLRMVQHMTTVVLNPPEAFTKEVEEFCGVHISKLLSRIKDLLRENESSQIELEDGSSEVDDIESIQQKKGTDIGFPLLPLSKGVTLSLRGRLVELENAAKAMRHL